MISSSEQEETTFQLNNDNRRKKSQPDICVLDYYWHQLGDILYLALSKAIK